ncbi:MAG: nucleotide exchange factor GrpE [Candidatus Micrarchaeota archaeon]
MSEEELLDQLKRAVAELDNSRKQWVKEAGEMREYASSKLINELLPLYQDFENALTLGSEEEKKAVQPLATKFFSILEKNGLNKIEIKKGDSFDLEKMEAVKTIEGEEGKITEVISTGFMFKEKVLKPAQVAVGKQVVKNE